MAFLIRLLVTAASLWVAVQLVPGIVHVGHWAALIAVALVFGIVNATIRPVLLFLTFPVVILTLGLFILVLNALMLWLTGALSAALGLGFHVEGFWAGLLGGLVVGLTSAVLNWFVGRERRR